MGRRKTEGTSLDGREDQTLTGRLLATAADIDSTALAARLISNLAHGTLTLANNGGFLYNNQLPQSALGSQTPA